MSKYNLIDIFEQYRIGSGWTNDFDYEGMLNAGLRTSLKDDIKVLKQIFEDFTDVNYHREAEHLSYAIDALEDGDAMEAEGRLSDFHAEIRKTMETFDMDMSDDLGAYMASKMDLDEDKYDDIADADDDIPADKKKAAALAYRKVDKGDSYEKATSHIKEVRVDRDVAERIEGLLSIPLKAKFLDVFEDLWLDLIEEDPFYAEDVVAHLSNEMHKQISNRQAQGDRLAGMEESFDSLAKKLDKQKGIDKDEAAKIAGSIAAKKAAGAGKGPTAKQKKRMKEASDTFNIDKVASPDAKAHDYGAEIKGISDEDDTEEAYAHQTVLPLEEIDPTLDPYEDRDEIIKQVMSLLIKEKGASKEELKGFIETHIEDILNAKDDDDVVDEFAQYLSVNEGDRELREHFGRFMKDYQ